jgi:CHAT domain-containing protein
MDDQNYLQKLMNEQSNQMRMGLGISNFKPTLNETRIEKQKLLEVLRSNLTKHVSEYETAMNDYWEALEIYHAAQLTRAKSRSKKSPEIPAPIEPTSQAKEYEKVIRQLELSIDEQVTLNDTQFQTYVMDDWFWKPVFAANNQTLAMYKSIDRSAR